VHNVYAPYRIPLFAELANHVHLDVLFCAGLGRDRIGWVAANGLPFRHKFLRSLRVGPLVVNPGLWRELRAREADVYLLADNQENSLSILLTVFFARWRRKAIVVWTENVPKSSCARDVFSSKYPNLISSVFERVAAVYRNWLYRNADTFASMSGASTDAYLVAAGVHPKCIFTGTQVMPSSLLPEVEVGAEWASYRPFLLYLGYFRPEKNVVSLVRAFRHSSTDSFNLLLAGSGPEEVALRLAADGASNIRFIGFVDGERKAQLIMAAEALVLPSLYEPWGMVVNESVHYGTPVLCSTAVAAAEILSSASSMLFADERELGHCLANFCGDNARRQELRLGAAAVAEEAVSDPAYGIRHILNAVTAALN